MNVDVFRCDIVCIGKLGRKERKPKNPISEQVYFKAKLCHERRAQKAMNGEDRTYVRISQARSVASDNRT